MADEKQEIDVTVSLKPIIKLWLSVVGIGLAGLLFLIVTTAVFASLVGTTLAVCWFIVLLIILIAASCFAVGTYVKALEEKDRLERNSRSRY